MLTLGEFTITVMNDDKVYIRHESGEGGEFSKSELVEVIGEFYRDRL